jgi:hypothetical protein
MSQQGIGTPSSSLRVAVDCRESSTQTCVSALPSPSLLPSCIAFPIFCGTICAGLGDSVRFPKSDKRHCSLFLRFLIEVGKLPPMKVSLGGNGLSESAERCGTRDSRRNQWMKMQYRVFPKVMRHWRTHIDVYQCLTEMAFLPREFHEVLCRPINVKWQQAP